MHNTPLKNYELVWDIKMKNGFLTTPPKLELQNGYSIYIPPEEIIRGDHLKTKLCCNTFKCENLQIVDYLFDGALK